MDIQVILAIIGAIAFFAGLFGGFTIKDLTISALPKVLRFFAFLVGILIIGVAAWPFVRDKVINTSSTTTPIALVDIPTMTITPQSQVTDTPTFTPANLLKPTATNTSTPTTTDTPQPTNTPTSTPTATHTQQPTNTPALPSPSPASLCPDNIPRSKVEEWRIGEVDSDEPVNTKIEEFNSWRQYRVSPYGNFKEGDHIPAGVVIAINLRNPWSQFPTVKPLINRGGYGLFETVGELIAPNEGACISIAP